jgi:hypothetical protein
MMDDSRALVLDAYSRPPLDTSLIPQWETVRESVSWMEPQIVYLSMVMEMVMVLVVVMDTSLIPQWETVMESLSWMEPQIVYLSMVREMEMEMAWS